MNAFSFILPRDLEITFDTYSASLSYWHESVVLSHTFTMNTLTHMSVVGKGQEDG